MFQKQGNDDQSLQPISRILHRNVFLNESFTSKDPSAPKKTCAARVRHAFPAGVVKLEEVKSEEPSPKKRAVMARPTRRQLVSLSFCGWEAKN